MAELSPPEPAVTVLLKVSLLVLTSKPGGGVTRTPAVKPDPLTWKLSDADGVPYIVESEDKLAEAVMVRGGDGVTVMVKVAGLPAQPVPAETKLPSDSGISPTGKVESTALVDVLITETELEPLFVT